MTGVELSVTGVEFTYPSGTRALRGVNLRIGPGEKVAIVGENGAGKTTLVRHLNGIFRPTAGSVVVDGWDTSTKSIAQLAAKVGYVFQNPDEQIFARTVAQDVAFGPKNLGASEEDAAARAEAALQRVGLAGAADHPPHQLSLSERKLVALAGVLAMDTPALVLDEPTTGQDQRGVHMISRVLAEEHAAGRTILAITHDMDFCVENFDRVIVMAQGQIHADGPPGQAFTNEALEIAAVEPPQLMRLAAGLGWGERPQTVPEFLAVWSARADR